MQYLADILCSHQGLIIVRLRKKREFSVDLHSFLYRVSYTISINKCCFGAPSNFAMIFHCSCKLINFVSREQDNIPLSFDPTMTDFGYELSVSYIRLIPNLASISDYYRRRININ